MPEFVVNNINTYDKLEKEYYDKVTFFDIFTYIKEEKFEKLLNFINLKTLYLYIDESLYFKLTDKLATFQKLENLQVQIDDRSGLCFPNDFYHYGDKMLICNIECQNCKLKICSNCNFTNSINSILVKNEIKELNILTINIKALLFLNNLPNTIERLQINIHGKLLKLKLDNLPCSLKELVIVHNLDIGDEQKDKIYDNIKLPFDCSFTLLKETKFPQKNCFLY